MDSWEKSVDNRPGYSASMKKRMLLNTENLLGIRRTGMIIIIFTTCKMTHFFIVKSFIEFVKFIFSMKEATDHKLSFLSFNLSQDPLECFFGCQRQRGGTCDNPTVKDFYNNTQALRVVDSFCHGPVQGNCRGNSDRNVKRMRTDDLTPLTRRK